jgi:aminotransferase EvaB
MNKNEIKVWDYIEEYDVDRQNIIQIVDKVFSSGQLILGENVKYFEEEFAEWCQSKFGIGVANGTDAIFLALKALEIGEGDEVITVANTAVPTVSAIAATGATPVFVDISLSDYLLDMSKLEKMITKNTKAILPVHLYGQMVDMEALTSISKTYNLFIVEDCAQAHGAEFNGKKAGSFGDISAFSFYPTKILGTFGDGGICITKSVSLAKKLKSLRFYGMKDNYFSYVPGFNSRLDEVHAAILRYKLKKLEDLIKKRREIAKIYDMELLNTSLKLPFEKENRKHSYYLYVVRHKDRSLLMNKLREKGIRLNISYPWPIHTMPAFSNKCIVNSSLTETEIACNNVFSLPMYPSLSEEKQNTVIKTIKNIL